MKKKTQKSLEETNAAQDLQSIIQQHRLFFDKLIELIPAKFYLPIDDERPWFQGLSKAEKAAAKKETRENIKKSRRERLDPDKPSATTLDLLKQSLDKEKLEGSNKEQVDMNTLTSGIEGDDRSMTYEELRQRLHRKIEEFRASRNCGSSNREKKREERNVKRGFQNKKRKKDDGNEGTKPKTDDPMEKRKKDAVEASKDLLFGHIKLDNEERHGKKKRKTSIHKEIEKAKKLEEAKKDPEKGEVIAKKQSWKAAMDRAAGIKVHDDPKLLEKSLKKEKKRQQKNSEKWKERIDTREKMKAEKQQRRSENIAERIHQKKMRKIAKREKKLMRPGFEGRKEGFINEVSG
ncbi:ribosomal RNA-processing protein 14-C isoform X2 [Prosopis cineraria]|nr:ribosomal RNA-processing protein 14-C isoform X2 [Prosopis cineraria]